MGDLRWHEPRHEHKIHEWKRYTVPLQDRHNRRHSACGVGDAWPALTERDAKLSNNIQLQSLYAVRTCNKISTQLCEYRTIISMSEFSYAVVASSL